MTSSDFYVTYLLHLFAKQFIKLTRILSLVFQPRLLPHKHVTTSRTRHHIEVGNRRKEVKSTCEAEIETRKYLRHVEVIRIEVEKQ